MGEEWINTVMYQFREAVKENDEPRMITLANLMLIDHNKLFLDELEKANDYDINEALKENTKYTSGWCDPYLE